ncbi:MAG: LysR substrate-binding domain-containing protein [Hyphomicrobiales bacterium]|nr:LysR substrate-binding domain-containing protein [Hyphomicrobiales bacterium]
MRNVSLKQLRMVAAAARGRSFAAAAEALHVTPPAVTAQMKLLEEEVGLPLFERDPTGLVPTAAGQEMIDAARRIEAVLQEARESLDAMRSPDGGRVTVGVVSTAKYFAPRLLAAFAREHPRVELELVVGNRSDILSRFEAGELDLSIMGRPPVEVALESALLGDHPHVVVAAPDDPLAGLRDLAPERLADRVFLVREPGSGTRTLMERFLEKTGIAPRIGMEIGSNETIKQAVIAGLGLTFISAHTVAAEIEDRRLVVLDVAGLPMWRRWYVVRLARKRPMPATRALLDFVTHEGREFLPVIPGLPERAPDA